jgi:hypothetical protein
MQNHRLKSDMEMGLKAVTTVANHKAMLQVTESNDVYNYKECKNIDLLTLTFWDCNYKQYFSVCFSKAPTKESR